MRIVICIDTDLSRSKTLCGKFSSRISSRRSSRIFCPTHHPLGCLALGFSARAVEPASARLYTARHIPLTDLCFRARSHPGSGGPLRVKWVRLFVAPWARLPARSGGSYDSHRV